MYRSLTVTIKSFSEGLKECNRPEDRRLISDYLAALAPLLTLTVLGEDISKALLHIERLFAHTWAIDIKPFEKAFEYWRNFKVSSQNV